ncbi:MAG: response regulator transcription factor [Syntrophomonadaceae bacterium]|nr:response regulator transcription factor [Syntrophomonadaceae bacterium]
MNDLVLVAHSDPAMVQIIVRALHKERYDTIAALGGEEAWNKVRTRHPRLAVFQSALPGISGWELCHRLRLMGNRMPVIVLIDEDEPARAEAVAYGGEADMIMAEPLDVRHLVTHVRSLTGAPPGGGRRRRRTLRAGALTVDVDRYEAVLDGVPLALTRKEFELLGLLLANKGKVMKRSLLLQALWGRDDAGHTRVLDVHICKLRNKMSAAGAGSVSIDTVRGVGYRLDERTPALKP